MNLSTYLRLKEQVIERGFQSDIDWCETVGPPATADVFVSEYVWAVLNSGMKAEVARRIWDRVWTAVRRGNLVSTVFRHPGKARAIQDALASKEELCRNYLLAGDKLAYLESLPWIGAITKYHLAKNFGLDVAKPDRHLQRLADRYNTTPEAMCKALSDQCGDRIGTVDYVIWRAASLGIISTRQTNTADFKGILT